MPAREVKYKISALIVRDSPNEESVRVASTGVEYGAPG